MALNFPSSPTVGQVYTDSTSGFSYEWDGTVWKSYSAASSSNIKKLDDISGSFNGSTQTFPLTVNATPIVSASAQSLIITLGGITQEPFTDYTVSSTNITFTSAPEAGLSFSGISLGPAVPVNYANDGNIYIRNTYVGSGTTGPFAFSQGYTVGYLDVYRNGVRLSSGTDFVGTSGTNFYLTDAAAINDEIEAIGYVISSLVQASSNLDNLSVTGVTTTNRLNVTTNAVVTGILTASGGFVGNLTGTASTASFATTSFGLSGTPNITVGSITAGNINSSGIITAVDGRLIAGVGIQSAGTVIGTGITTLNFVGTGNTFSVNGTTVNISIAGGGAAAVEFDITSSLFF